MLKIEEGKIEVQEGKEENEELRKLIREEAGWEVSQRERDKSQKEWLKTEKRKERIEIKKGKGGNSMNPSEETRRKSAWKGVREGGKKGGREGNEGGKDDI